MLRPAALLTVAKRSAVSVHFIERKIALLRGEHDRELLRQRTHVEARLCGERSPEFEIRQAVGFAVNEVTVPNHS